LENNWLLLLSYQGAAYHGWQIQPSHPSIEGELEQAILRLTGVPTKVHGAGRTDSGVHALNQTASFSSKKDFSAQKWRQALNAVLPNDIVVKQVLSVDSDFHARHSAIGKQYRYLIYNAPYCPPFARSCSWWTPAPLNLDKMQQAAEILLGTHDFSAFRSVQCSSPNTVKTLSKISIEMHHTPASTLYIDLEANSFLQYMVRIIVGTLVDAGLGKRSPEGLEAALKSKDRRNSGKTAPAHGLYVLKVIYPEHLICWDSAFIDF